MFQMSMDSINVTTLSLSDKTTSTDVRILATDLIMYKIG